MNKTKRTCSKHVFSNARWDVGGHKCSVTATVERDGKWWCKRHDPQAEAARAEAAIRADAARRNADDVRKADALYRIAALGGGTPHWSSVLREYTGGVTLSPMECDVLIARLTEGA